MPGSITGEQCSPTEDKEAEINKYQDRVIPQCSDELSEGGGRQRKKMREWEQQHELAEKLLDAFVY